MNENKNTLQWLDHLAITDNKINERKNNRDFFSFLLFCSNQGDLKPIDDILLNANPEKLSKHALIGLTRGTFIFRKNLTNWVFFRDLVKQKLIEKNENYQSILIGLLD
jgi:hypothetical protein